MEIGTMFKKKRGYAFAVADGFSGMQRGPE
jgi:hypothetical protein